MRQIKYIVVHCTAGRTTQSVADLRAEFKRKGWKNPGYHYVVQRDGYTVQLLDHEKVANGVKGFNSKCIHIAYIGGVDDNLKPVDNRTPEQKHSLKVVIKVLKKLYPDAQIRGHRDLAKRDCPCFDAKEEYKAL